MKLDELYSLSPLWLKTIGVNYYALKNNAINYSSVGNEMLERIEKFNEGDWEQKYEYQLHRLRALVRKALEASHYRALSSSLAALDSMSIAEVLAVLPILNKDNLRLAPKGFVTPENGSKRLTLHTSGTSGTPLDIVCSGEARTWNYAFYRAMLRRSMVDYKDRSVTFAGRKIVPIAAKRGPYSIPDFITNTLYCSSYHLSEATAIDYARAIGDWAPAYIDAYPSAVFELACSLEFMHHNISPQVIFTSSETLLDYQREKIEKVFNCPVVDSYGCTEMVVCAPQWPSKGGEYVPDPMFGIVEVLDENGRQAAPGEEGDLVCTGFLNDSMPLLRYSLGDRVAVAKRWTVNGFHYYSFSKILGRQDDVITTPEGRKVGRLDPAFKGISGIKAAQIHQVALDRIVVRLELSVPIEEFSSERLVAAIRERTSSQIAVDVVIVDQIPRTGNGKFRSVISDVNRKK